VYSSWKSRFEAEGIRVDRVEIFKKLEPIFHEVLDSTLVLTNDLDASKVPEWDSLNHITLIVEIEQRFGVELTTNELAELRNVGDMVSLLERKGV
jgi:acyl carrier protein